MQSSGDQLTFQRLRQIVVDQLCPMLVDLDVDDVSVPSAGQTESVVLNGSSTVLIQPRGVVTFQLKLTSSRPLDTAEIKIIKSFVGTVSEIWSEFDRPYFPSLVQYCDQEVVAQSVRRNIVDDTLIPLLLRNFDAWASQTYEGGRIAAAFGIDPRPDARMISKVHISEFLKKDFAKVLTNGMDVLLVLSPSGHLVRHVALPEGETSDSTAPSFAPVRAHALARWANKGRVALVLNRHGETMVFDNSRLRFTKRRGRWFCLPHEVVIDRMGTEIDELLRRCVYETCLDISFGRHGGCIAIALDERQEMLDRCLPQEERFSLEQKERTRVIKHCVGMSFAAIPRLRRLALASADGAVVLDQQGEVLAAGSIVRVRGGSDSGGRRAAAAALSRSGIAIKVSADGGIVCFGRGGTLDKPHILFELCA